MWLATTEAVAQSAPLQAGSRSLAMGNSSVCLSDVWAVTNNIAGLAEYERTSIAASYHAIPSFKHFNRMAVVLASPVASGMCGLSVFRFGDDLYNEHVASLGYANRFGLASLGIKANYIQYRAEGFEARRAVTFSFGGLATLTPQLLFGACVTNINQPTVNVLTDEKIPTRLVAGIAFKPSDNFIAVTEIEKEIHLAPIIRAGIEYRAFGKAAFRTGFNLRPQAGFMGFGLKVNRLELDYAIELNHAFGVSHQATVTCQLQRT